jgi:predicted ester cyclase
MINRAWAAAGLLSLAPVLGAGAQSAPRWALQSEATRVAVYRMEARVNQLPEDAGGRQKAYEDYMASFSPQVVVHGLIEGTTNYQGVRQFYAPLFATLRGSVLVSDELIVAGPMAAQRYHAVGRMTGVFDGATLTNRLVALRGQTFFRLGEDGRISERWSNHDHGYRMAQTLGAAGAVQGAHLALALNGPGLSEQRVYERLDALRDAFNLVNDPERREQQLLSLFDPSVIVHDDVSPNGDLAALRRELRSLWAAFPDLVINQEARLSAWSMGAIRWRGTGSQRGEWHRMPANWQPVELSGELILRFGGDGRIAELWSYQHPVRPLESALRTIRPLHR